MLIVPVVVCVCVCVRLCVREEHTVTVFGNRVLRGIFGLKMDEVTGDTLHDLHSSPPIIRVITSRRLGGRSM